MNSFGIENIIAGLQKKNHQPILLKETHISWVILTDQYVYKIKKEIKFSFLDFSSIQKREERCHKEIQLNRRLTQDVYLDVLPITKSKQDYFINGPGKIVDYCVKMRRLDNDREMQKVIEKGQLTFAELKNIADELIPFHQEAQIIKEGNTAKDLWEDFEDIRQVQSFIESTFGKKERLILEEILHFIKEVLLTLEDSIKDRIKSEMIRDCHGDLHSGNIFLLEKPVIFDCIEFNHHFRQIDILNELAFFCMDLDFYNYQQWSQDFINYYNTRFQVIREPSERTLFLYYKLYRANVKVKVNALKVLQQHATEVRTALYQKYFALMQDYYHQLRERTNAAR